MRINIRPLTSIRAKCRDCTCNNYNEITNCQIFDCALWPYRFGKRPDEATITEWKKKIEEIQRGKTK